MSNINVTVDINSNQPVLPPQSGFYYVDQANYLSLPLKSDGFTIYSDSATSCIITIVISTTGDESSVTLAHLDSPQCIEAFFEIIKSSNADSYQIFAQGANPPENKTSIENATQLTKSMDQLKSKVFYSELYLRQGDPRTGNRGDFGMVYHGNGNATVTNQPYKLEVFQRDPTCGAETVYCIMRRHVTPPVQIRDAALPFTHKELVQFSLVALQYRTDSADPSTAFTNIVNLKNEEIRNTWSTTPEYEAPWFSDQLKLGSAFALAMAPVVGLSAKHLLGES